MKFFKFKPKSIAYRIIVLNQALEKAAITFLMGPSDGAHSPHGAYSCVYNQTIHTLPKKGDTAVEQIRFFYHFRGPRNCRSVS